MSAVNSDVNFIMTHSTLRTMVKSTVSVAHCISNHFECMLWEELALKIVHPAEERNVYGTTQQSKFISICLDRDAIFIIFFLYSDSTLQKSSTRFLAACTSNTCDYPCKEEASNNNRSRMSSINAQVIFQVSIQFKDTTPHTVFQWNQGSQTYCHL